MTKLRLIQTLVCAFAARVEFSSGNVNPTSAMPVNIRRIGGGEFFALQAIAKPNSRPRRGEQRRSLQTKTGLRRIQSGRPNRCGCRSDYPDCTEYCGEFQLHTRALSGGLPPDYCFRR